MAVGDGFVEVTDESVTVLTDMAVEEQAIDETAAEAAVKRAQAALSGTRSEWVENSAQSAMRVKCPLPVP